MLDLEPIPELSALLLAAQMARFPSPGVTDSIKALQARCRAPSSARDAWKANYRDVLGKLIPQLLAAQEKQALHQKIAQALTGIQAQLQAESNHWQARLQEQEGQLAAMVDRAAEKLDVTSRCDHATAERVFEFGPAALASFWEYLQRVEQQWADNNGKLVAVRAVEAIAPLLEGVRCEVRPAELRLATLESVTLRGERIPEPGFFHSLGATYRTIMTAVTAVSSLGFFFSRVVAAAPQDAAAATHAPAGGISMPTVLAIASVAVFVAAVVYAVTMMPRERRQSMARLEARARVTLSRELVTAAKAHLSKAAKSQHTQLLRHLTAEATRIKAELGGSGTGAVPLPLLGGGLMPGDVAKLKGEWKVAIEKHLATF